MSGLSDMIIIPKLFIIFKLNSFDKIGKKIFGSVKCKSLIWKLCGAKYSNICCHIQKNCWCVYSLIFYFNTAARHKMFETYNSLNISSFKFLKK